MAKFAQGQSGNPSGRPAGTPDRRTQFRELLQPHANDLIEKCVEMALSGDVSAMRICIDRICPPLKPQSEPIAIAITSSNTTDQTKEVLQAVAAGNLTLDEGHQLVSMLLNQSRITEIDENSRKVEQMLQRLQALQSASPTLHNERYAHKNRRN